MRLLQIVFSILLCLGYLGNGFLFLYIEWSFLRQGFIQILNPFLHLQILGVLLTTPLFWIFLAMAVVGYYATMRIENHLQGKRVRKNTEAVVSSRAQTFQDQVPSFSVPFVQEEPIDLATPVHSFPEADIKSQSELDESAKLPAPVQSFSEPGKKLEVELVESEFSLLEWAIQSSQKIAFHYKKQNGEESDRIVTPIRLTTVEQTSYLEGHCYLRRAKRTFAIDRMSALRIISPDEAKVEQGASQEILYIKFSNQADSTLQPQTVSGTDKISTPTEQRPFIRCATDELERITHSEWNNVKVLNQLHYELGFRSRRRAYDLRRRISTRLKDLQNTQFAWSTTTATPGSRNLSNDAFRYEEGVLRQYGYKVGKNGLSERERWEILDTVFLSSLSQINNAAYLNEWGEPISARRLQKLSESIAAFARNAKRRDSVSFRKAIQDWETDLAYLKRTYYNNRFSFQYPRT